MAGGRRAGGAGGPIKRVLWMFVVACIAVALVRGFGFGEGGTLSDMMPGLRERSEKVETQVKDGVKKVGLPEGGSVPVKPSKPTSDVPVGPTHY